MSLEKFQGIENAHKRAILKTMGLTDDDLSKPLVAVVATSTNMPNGNHIYRIIDSVKAGILAKGGVPVVMSIPSFCDEFSLGSEGAKYALPSRELIADSVESILISHSFDGAVFVPINDTASAGMLLGSIRINIPSIFVSSGCMASSRLNGKNVNFNSVLEAQGKVRSGEMDLSEASTIENTACSFCGYSCTSGVNNAMDCFIETIGMALSGNGSIPAGMSDRIRLAKNSGIALMKLISNDITPRMIMTRDAFLNAITVDLSIGTSTSTLLHVLAFIEECGIQKLDLEAISKMSTKIPSLFALSPTQAYDNLDFYMAGGVMAVMRELNKNGLIVGNTITASNKPVSSVFASAKIANSNVIKTIDNAVFPTSSLVIMDKGNLADYAVVRKVFDGKSATQFVGKAKVFNSEEDAVNSINAGNIKKGDIVVIRYEGPKGGPGMREMIAPIVALVGQGLQNDVALITDGRFASGLNALAVDCIAPEAMAHGKIALIEDGDKITIDLTKAKLDVDMNAKDAKIREKKLRLKDSNPTGYLLRYKYLVTSSDKGATLKKKF